MGCGVEVDEVTAGQLGKRRHDLPLREGPESAVLIQGHVDPRGNGVWEFLKSDLARRRSAAEG